MKYPSQKEAHKNHQQIQKTLQSSQPKTETKRLRFDFGKQKSKDQEERLQRIKKAHSYYCLLSKKKFITKSKNKRKLPHQTFHECQKFNHENMILEMQVEKQIIEGEIGNSHIKDNILKNEVATPVNRSQRELSQSTYENKQLQNLLNQDKVNFFMKPESKKKKFMRDPIQVNEETLLEMQKQGSLHIYSEQQSRRISSRLLEKSFSQKNEFTCFLENMNFEEILLFKRKNNFSFP